MGNANKEWRLSLTLSVPAGWRKSKGNRTIANVTTKPNPSISIKFSINHVLNYPKTWENELKWPKYLKITVFIIFSTPDF